MENQQIYEQEFVKELFDEMSGTYNTVNLISSFGFCVRWRRQCIEQVELQSGMTVYDFMSGMGEGWQFVLPKIGQKGKLIGVDFSKAMCQGAKEEQKRWEGFDTEVRQVDVFKNGLMAESADCVFSNFGLKTFSDEQLKRLAQEVHRVLKPGGSFAFLEISEPKRWFLKPLYLFYIKFVIPIVGQLFLGNPDNYRMLGVYTTRFGNCERVAEYFRDAGLDVEVNQFFFGCATGIAGKRPLNT